LQAVKGQRQIQKQRQPDSPIFEGTNLLKLGWFGVGVGVAFDFHPLGTQHFVLYRKWIRNRRCLSRRRVSSVSHFL
ncbi:hypothetical protein, partial [Undibacterium sp.]|uniref:hypothetical protein n=1 Tax=Undibacterium sp. TaxID=1914977 RepID=UPI002CCD93DB